LRQVSRDICAVVLALIVRCLPSSHGTFFFIFYEIDGEPALQWRGREKQGKGNDILSSGGSSSGAGGIMISRTGEPLFSSEQYGSVRMKNNHLW